MSHGESVYCHCVSVSVQVLLCPLSLLFVICVSCDFVACVCVVCFLSRSCQPSREMCSLIMYALATFAS